VVKSGACRVSAMVSWPWIYLVLAGKAGLSGIENITAYGLASFRGALVAKSGEKFFGAPRRKPISLAPVCG
jgi:hypothetical protein